MKITLQKTLILTGFMALSAMAQAPFFDNNVKPVEKPDTKKFSYAIGMNLGSQLKQAGKEIDADTVAQAIKDVQQGKPTLIKESEIREIFMQVQEYDTQVAAKKTAKYKADGEAFMAKNAKAPDVTVLPDGLQYKILAPGAGEVLKTNETFVVNFKGKWIDGSEFTHKDYFQVPLHMIPQAWEKILPLMKYGAKWEVYVPSAMAYGQQGQRAGGFGSALIYDLEVLSPEAVGSNKVEHFSGGRMGHGPGEEFYPLGSASPPESIGK